MKIGSYVRDTHGTQSDFTRSTYRAGLVAGGLSLIGMGVLASVVSIIAGIPFIIFGIGLTIWSAKYFRPIE